MPTIDKLASLDSISSDDQFPVYSDANDDARKASASLLTTYMAESLSGKLGADDIVYAPAGTGAVSTTVQSKLRESVSVLDFGADPTGVSDSTAAIQNAINYASEILTDGTGDIDQVRASVKFPSGKYKTTASIQLKNCVQISGDGSGSTWILVSHAGDAFYTTTGQYAANLHVSGVHLESAGTARDGFVIDGQIRNCYYHDVGCRGFRYSFNVLNTWTAKFDQCYSYECVRHFNAGVGTGGLHIYGGRYDVASDHGVYVDATAAELIMNDVAVQFGNKSAIYVKNCYTVELNQCFFEGNCIGNTNDYYVYISNDSVQSLSSASVINCVMNNLADSNRNGLGVLFIQNIVGFNYVERWTRNTVQPLPVIGSNVTRRAITWNGAESRSTTLTGIEVGSANNAVINQVARPMGIFGQDMADVSFAPTTRAALNVGLDASGVALGTFNSIGAIAAYGGSSVLQLNPSGGSVKLGDLGAEVATNTNEFFGRYRHALQITSSNLTPNSTTSCVLVNCSGGNRNITLTNITHASGRIFSAKKTDGGANQLIVTPSSGTIDGAASFSSTTAYASVRIISDGTNWFTI